MWQSTWAGAKQAFLAGKRYVVRRHPGFFQPWDSAPWVAELNPEGEWQEIHKTEDEAKAACEGHAGTKQYDAVPKCWDCSGREPARYVG